MLGSCQFSKKDCPHLGDLTYYKNGKLHAKVFIDCQDNDSKIVINYYPNGDTESVAYIYKDKRNGLYRHYFPNNKLDSEGFYLDGLQDSVCKFYFHNGIMEARTYWKKGLLFADQYDYDSLKRLQKYSYYFNNQLILLKTYNADSTIGKEVGSYLAVEKRKTGDYYEGDSLLFIYDLIVPPLDSLNFYMCINNCIRPNEKKYTKIDLKKNQAIFGIIKRMKGDYILKVKVEGFRYGETKPTYEVHTDTIKILPG